MSQKVETFDHPFVVSYASVGIGVTASMIIPHVKKKTEKFIGHNFKQCNRKCSFTCEIIERKGFSIHKR